MEYDLKIRQSYHGAGGKDGYRYELYNNKEEKIGRLHKVPTSCRFGSTISINGIYYIISALYDSQNPNEENDEVIYYELKRYEFKPDFDLGEIIEQ
ncbi:hypothetical protein [Bacillus sp. NPDC094106]|uniref:hypothetical protein n=1 Tax=Bacillus sp. NPDC094106 TaxID=3363949 RepID=UPI0037F9AD8E